jgi:hypothetical protein
MAVNKVSAIAKNAKHVAIPDFLVPFSTARSIKGLANQPNCATTTPSGPATKAIHPGIQVGFAQSRCIRGSGLFETAGKYSDKTNRMRLVQSNIRMISERRLSDNISVNIGCSISSSHEMRRLVTLGAARCRRRLLHRIATLRKRKPPRRVEIGPTAFSNDTPPSTSSPHQFKKQLH